MGRPDACLIVALLGLACAPEVPPAEPAMAAEGEGARADAVDWDPALATASVRGRVRSLVSPPAPRTLDLRSDPACLAAHASPPQDDAWLVGEEGGLANAWVSVEDGLEAWRFPPPSEPVVLEQRGCLFRPRVVALRVGQILRVTNADPVTHNVHVTDASGTRVNRVQRPGAAALELRFERPSTVSVRCDLHGWMRAEVGVFANPFHVVTDADGGFDLGRLPAGTFTLRIRHEVLGSLEYRLELEPGEERFLELEL